MFILKKNTKINFPIIFGGRVSMMKAFRSGTETIPGISAGIGRGIKKDCA
ncbi:MAG: hypothetical protein ACLUR5_17300 [Eubacterium ventriosum]